MITAAELKEATRKQDIELAMLKILAASKEGRYDAVINPMGDHVFDVLKEAGYVITEISRTESTLFDWKIRWA